MLDHLRHHARGRIECGVGHARIVSAIPLIIFELVCMSAAYFSEIEK